jgi:uncharacterized protein (TIGR02246 family)
MRSRFKRKKVLLFLLLGIMLQHAAAQDAGIDQIKKLNQDWINFSIKKDTAGIARIFADDFVLINPMGKKLTKKDVIGNLLFQDILSDHIDSLDIRLISPGVGILSCYTTFVLRINGSEVKGRNCYQDVYIKRKNRWLAIAAHVTSLSLP